MGNLGKDHIKGTSAVSVSPPGPSAAMAGTFMVARILWRSLSWMGCVLEAGPAGMEGVWAAGVVGVTVGELVEVAAGVTGVVGAWVELMRAADPEEGVAAADWLRELCVQKGDNK